MCWTFQLSFILQSTAVWYLISPSPLTCGHSANFPLWFIPHSAGLCRQAAQLKAAVTQQSTEVWDKRFQGFCSVWFSVWPSCFMALVYGPWPLPGCCALHVVHISCCHIFFFFSTKIPPQMGVFGLSQYRAAGMLASVGEVKGGFTCVSNCTSNIFSHR